jgi:hypothetical protein
MIAKMGMTDEGRWVKEPTKALTRKRAMADTRKGDGKDPV